MTGGQSGAANAVAFVSPASSDRASRRGAGTGAFPGNRARGGHVEVRVWEVQDRRSDPRFNTGPDPDLSITDLAERAGVAQSTASREVARLADHGIVVVRHLGRNALVAANWDLPWATELRSILTKTVGVLGRLGDALHAVDGIEEAWVFGSWAARFLGEPGPPPRDVDIVVVGTVALRTVRAACRGLVDDLGVDVNPIVVTDDAWNDSADVFTVDIRTGPLVQVPHPVRPSV